MASFGIKLKQLRLKSGMSYRDVEVRTGVSEKQMRYYEQDTRKPTCEKVMVFAELFGVTVEELVGVPEHRLAERYNHERTWLCEQIKKLTISEYTRTELATMLGCSEPTITKIIKEVYPDMKHVKYRGVLKPTSVTYRLIHGKWDNKTMEQVATELHTTRSRLKEVIRTAKDKYGYDFVCKPSPVYVHGKCKACLWYVPCGEYSHCDHNYYNRKKEKHGRIDPACGGCDRWERWNRDKRMGIVRNKTENEENQLEVC